jgi:hypothetical protein
MFLSWGLSWWTAAPLRRDAALPTAGAGLEEVCLRVAFQTTFDECPPPPSLSHESPFNPTRKNTPPSIHEAPTGGEGVWRLLRATANGSTIYLELKNGPNRSYFFPFLDRQPSREPSLGTGSYWRPPDSAFPGRTPNDRF